MTDSNKIHYSKMLSLISVCLSEFRMNIIIMFFVSLIWAIDFSYRKFLLKNIFDIAIINENNKNLANELAMPVSAYILMGILITIVFRLYGYFIDIKMCPNLKQRLANKFYTKLLEHDYLYYQENLTGNLVHKLSNLIESSIELLKLIIDKFIAYCIAIIIAIYTLNLVDEKFALITLIWIIIFIITTIYLFPVLSFLSNEYAKTNTRTTALAADSLMNISSVKLFNNILYEKLKFFKACRKNIESEQKLNTAYFWLWFFYGCSFDFIQILSIYFLVYDLQFNYITLGDFILVISINTAIIDILNQTTLNVTKYADHFGKVSNALNSILPNSKPSKKISNLKSKNLSQISFQNVSFSYNKKDFLFKNLSVNIRKNEKIGIVGASGSGKSSFIKLLLGLLSANNGEITINNILINSMNTKKIINTISVVSQDITLFHDTLWENIRYGNLDAREDDIKKAINLAGISEFMYKLPKGYNTIVGEKGFNLSGGEKQRIGIARAFLKNTNILIFDEATNHLDSIIKQQIHTNLLNFLKHKTAIFITHNLSALIGMDRILVFKKGKIIQDGTHEELIKKDGVYRKLWSMETIV